MLNTCIIITSVYYITFRRIIDKQNRLSTVGINWVLLELQAMLSNSYTSALKDWKTAIRLLSVLRFRTLVGYLNIEKWNQPKNIIYAKI